MYSSSSSFLGSGNSGRPGGPQYGQTTFSNQPQQQSSSGFGRAPLQPQLTGYPGHSQQQGFQPQQQQSQQFNGYLPPNQQPGPQQQQFNTGQPPPQVPLKTGQTSSQIAQSFQSPQQSSQLAGQNLPAGATKIPKFRLSFLTATDQAKFEQLFKSAVGDGQALDGRSPVISSKTRAALTWRRGESQRVVGAIEASGQRFDADMVRAYHYCLQDI